MTSCILKHELNTLSLHFLFQGLGDEGVQVSRWHFRLLKQLLLLPGFLLILLCILYCTYENKHYIRLKTTLYISVVRLGISSSVVQFSM